MFENHTFQFIQLTYNFLNHELTLARYDILLGQKSVVCSRAERRAKALAFELRAKGKRFFLKDFVGMTIVFALE